MRGKIQKVITVMLRCDKRVMFVRCQTKKISRWRKIQFELFTYPFYFIFRALSKLSSVATVDQPPSKMCDSMKGSLIKKQVNWFLSQWFFVFINLSILKKNSLRIKFGPCNSTISIISIQHKLRQDYNVKNQPKSLFICNKQKLFLLPCQSFSAKMSITDLS